MMWRSVFVSRLFRNFRVALRNRIPFLRGQSGIASRISFVGLICPPSLYAFTWPFTSQPEMHNVPDKDDPITIEKRLFGQSLVYIEFGEYSQANQLLHKLLHHLHTEHQNNDINDLEYTSRRARVCSELANLNLLEGKFEPAESLLKQTIQDCISSGLPVTSSEVVELSLKLALIYDQLGRDEEADTGFRFCIITQENKMTSQDCSSVTPAKEMEKKDIENSENEAALLGMSCNYYAKFLFDRGDSRLALSFAERSLQVASQIYPASHPNCLHLLSSIGVIHAECANDERNDEGHIDRARDFLKRAYDLARSSFDACSREAGGDCESTGAEGRVLLSGSLANILIEWALIEARTGQKATAAKLVAEAESVLKSASPTNTYRQRLAQVKRECSL